MRLRLRTFLVVIRIPIESELQRLRYPRRREVTIGQILESARRIRVRDNHIRGRDADGCEIKERRRAGQDGRVEILWEDRDLALRHAAAFGVPDAHDVLHFSTADGGLAEHLDDVVRDLDLEVELHVLGWVRVVGEAGAEAVVGKGGVAGGGSDVDVAVTRAEVPIRAVEGAAVSQELYGLDFVG